MNPTPESTAARPEDDPRLLRTAQEYLAELEAGCRPRRAEFVARFPDIAAELAPYLDALDMVHGAAPRLNSSSGKPVLIRARARAIWALKREVAPG